MPTWIVERGEAVSFLVVVVVLALSMRPVARAYGLSPRIVEEHYWWGGIAFLIIGRLAFLAEASADLLLDVMVVIRFTDGIAPVIGGTAALAWVLWRGRGTGSGAPLAVAVTGLILAAAAYGLACPVRGACFGATAPAPLGFPMHGLLESRLATPAIEGIVLLAILAVAVRLIGRWPLPALAWGLLSALALVRVAMMPLSAAGVDGPTAVALLLAAIVSGGLAWRALRATSGTAPAA